MALDYFTPGFATVGTDKSAVSIISATTVRPSLYEFVIGSVATPGDTATDWRIQRFTADGTGTSVTPTPTDPTHGVVAKATSKVNYSAEPTVTANLYLFQLSLNQRNSFRWVMVPRKPLIIPATAANGVVLKSESSTGTAVHEGSVWWEE